MNRTKSLLEIINYYKVSNALFLLGEYGIFEWLNGNESVSDICNKLDINHEALKIILDMFAAMGLFEKKDNEFYTVAPEYGELLNIKAPNNLIDLIKLESYLAKEHTNYEILKKTLVTGEGRDTFNINGKEGKEQLYINTMNNGNLFSAMCVARELRNIEGRILDIAGGSGIYSISLAKINDTVSIDIVDKQEVQMLCEQNIKEAGYSDNIHYISGDINSMEFQSTYDGLILSNILHLLTHDEIENLFSKLNRYLSNTAAIVFHDFFISDMDSLIPSIYTLDWMMHGSFFNYGVTEFTSYIKKYGWIVRKIKRYSKIETTIIVAQKE